jgi:hypothetical protein
MGVSLRSRAEVGTATHVRLTRAGVAVVIAFALLAAFYAWTATSSGNPFTKVTPFGFNVGDDDYYNLQADAFLHGRLWVDAPIDPQMLTAKNPYTLNNAWKMRDGSFYQGRYYLTWGPAPAVTTFLPPRLVGLRIQENLAVTLYCFFGALFAAMALTLLVRRLVPGTPRPVIWTGSATIALATSMPWSLRTPTIYQAAITAAFFFMMAGLLVLLRELLREQPPRRGHLSIAATLFGLAVLSRPPMVFVVLGVTVLAWLLRPEARRRTVPLILGITAIAGIIFMAYNMARFSGPLDFGHKWLTGGDFRHVPFNDITNLPPGLYGYLIAPLHMTVGFPYFHLPPPPDAPLASNPIYNGEPTGSMLWAVPFALLALAVFARRRPAASYDTPVLKPVVLTLLAIGIFVLIADAYAIPGYTERYKLDFLPWIVMAATLSWAAMIHHAPTPRRAGRWRRGGIALAAWGILVGVAVSFTGNGNVFYLYNHGRFQSLERALSPLPTLVAEIVGRPMIAAIRAPKNAYSFSLTVAGGYTTLDIPDARFPLTPQEAAEVTIVSPNARTARLTFHTATTTPGTVMIFGSAANKTTSALVHDGGTGTLPLHLQRGVNYVFVGVTAGTDVPSNAPVGVQLGDFRLR